MRIYEIAKMIGCTSKDVMSVLDDLGVVYKTHSSSVSEENISKIEKRFEKLEKKLEKTKAAHSKTESKKTKKSSVKDELAKKPKGQVKVAEKQKAEKQKATETPTKKKSNTKTNSKKQSTVTASRSNEKEKPEEKITKDSDSEIQSEEISQDRPSSIIQLKPGQTPKTLGEEFDVSPAEIVKQLFLLGSMVNANQLLDQDTISILAEEFDKEIEFVEGDDSSSIGYDDEIEEEVVEPSQLVNRPPVVTIMGHVNHGKTTLLDTLRKSRVADGETGGITQHIGAYLIDHNGSKICFIDTPGHQAFSGMREMGANVTDIVILVVAATEGIKPQTLESIKYAKEAEVPIIVAINKIDAPNANIDKVKSELSENGVTPEDWGGDYLCVPISALNGDGIDDLLDTINLQADLLELKSNPKGKSFGIVLESCQTEHMGPLVTVLVKNGTFKVGDALVCGPVFGKIRRLEDDLGKNTKSASPSIPVRVFGFADVPAVSARVKVVANERKAKAMASDEAMHQRQAHLSAKEKITMDNLFSSLENETKKEFKFILKTDVAGSIDALKNILGEIPSEKIRLNILQAGTGSITDSDVLMAQSYGATIIAYRVKVPGSVKKLCKQHKVVINEFDIIYRVHEYVKASMEDLLEDSYEEFFIGKCDVKQVFRVSKIGAIAGSLVTEGKIIRGSYCSIIRNGQTLPDRHKVFNIKHYKDDVSEVKAGMECGVSLEDFKDFEQGDTLEFYEKRKIQTVL